MLIKKCDSFNTKFALYSQHKNLPRNNWIYNIMYDNNDQICFIQK